MKDKTQYKFDVKRGTNHKKLFTQKEFINRIDNVDVIVKSKIHNFIIPDNVDDIKIGMLARSSVKIGGKFSIPQDIGECVYYRKNKEEKKIVVFIKNGECQIINRKL